MKDWIKVEGHKKLPDGTTTYCLGYCNGEEETQKYIKQKKKEGYSVRKTINKL